MLQLNKTLLNEKYKEIWRLLITDCVPMPYLIKENVQKEFKPNRLEMEEFGKNMDKETSKKLGRAYYNRRLIEREIWDSTTSMNKRKKLFQEYKENELLDFVKKYPKYKKILVE